MQLIHDLKLISEFSSISYAMQSENKPESKKSKSKINQSNQNNKPMLRILMLHGYR